MYRFTTATKKLLGDLHTPVSLYLKLRDVYPQSALLESSDYHGGENSLSFIAFRPVARIGVNNGEALLEYPDGRSVAKPLGETCAAADALKEFLNEFRVDGDGSELCGLFGYTAFDAVRYFENIPVREFHHRDSDAPDICYILYKFLLVFDHFKNELSIVELCADGERDYIREVETLIEDRNFASYNFRTVGERRSNLTDETYREMVRQGVRHCLRGDVFQIVLSRRFEQPFQGDDFKVYRALRRSIPRPTSSISISGASASSAPRPRRTARSRTAAPRSTPSRARLSAPETRRWTASGPNGFWPTPRRTPSTSCWSIWRATT